MACCYSFLDFLVFVLTFSAFFPAVVFTVNGTEKAPGNITDANFDTLPLNVRECTARPQGVCTPASLDASDCAFLSPTSGEYYAKRQQTHITLVCGEEYPDADITKDVFQKQTVAISKRSRHRAVYVEIRNDTLLDAIQPIRQQIVVLKIKRSIDNLLTFRVGLLGLINLLEIYFEDCQPLIIHQRDLSPLQNLRIILFYATAIRSVQPTTFTDLPKLQVFGVSNIMYFPDDEEIMLDLNRFYCDPRNEWFWKWLAANPRLSVERTAGSVFKIGTLQNKETWFQETGVAPSGVSFNDARYACNNERLALTQKQCLDSSFALYLCKCLPTLISNLEEK
ncbi:uncharacterized protein LOC129597876 [Paramacrobiotus metropolitanus]|uniref:uncharacterized protein LOC129597876 n=1 Tax=Paramacrobiotus metropolitanus TaxID=2943436 RepID=UPI0024457A92|nr:uncharacterized protein LOC129597876 [Paramacrobiotus metropolitanus]